MRIKVLLLAAFLGWGGGAAANVRVLPRQIDHLRAFGLSVSTVRNVWVESVQIAYVDYSALRRDFPALRTKSESEIDRILIENFSYVSEAQLALAGLRNTDVPARHERTRDAFRPTAYGRADLMELRDLDGQVLGLVDRKGAGVTERGADHNLKKRAELGEDEILTLDHSDGLASLGESLVETTRQSARQRMYDLSRTGAQTVETYFVLRFPFSIRKPNGELIPAAVYGRQAHIGRSFSFVSPLVGGEGSVSQQDFFGAGVDQGLVRILDQRLKSTFGAYGPKPAQEMADWTWAHETARGFAERGERWVVEKHIEDMLRPLPASPDVRDELRKPSFEAELETFFELFAFSTNVRNRRVAAEALGHLRDPALLKREVVREAAHVLLGDADAKVRELVARVIGAMAPEERWPLLERAAADTAAGVREALILVPLSDVERAMVYEKIWPRARPEARERIRAVLEKVKATSSPALFALAQKLGLTEGARTRSFEGIRCEAYISPGTRTIN